MEKLTPLAVVILCLCAPHAVTAALVWYFTRYGLNIQITRRRDPRLEVYALDQKMRDQADR